MISIRPALRVHRPPHFRFRPTFLQASALAFVLLLGLAWVTVLGEEIALAGQRATAFSPEHLAVFVGRLLGIGATETPAFLRPDAWRAALGLAVETLAMSVLATGLAALVVLPTVIVAARNVAFGDLRPTASPLWPAVFFLVRTFYLVTRSIPELIWAMLIIFVFSPSILPGALALALHNLGVLGKLGAEVVENLDARPVRALQRTGARPLQILAYGILPSVLPQFLTYLLYRWEVIIRTTIVVGFVGAGGLGREFRLNLSWFHYTEVMLILMVYFGLVLLVDAGSGILRRLAR